eukprot:13366-Heterococcus_DN1.PRE.2
MSTSIDYEASTGKQAYTLASAARVSGTCDQDDVVQVARMMVEADVVQGFVVEGEALVSVLNQLVHRQGGVVGLRNSVRLGGRGARVGGHDAVWVLLAQWPHLSKLANAQGVCHQEALQAVARLSLFSHNVQHRVDRLDALSVVALSPAVAR